MGIDRRAIVRFALAGTVAGATWRGAAWLYTYQEGVVIKWVDRTGYQFELFRGDFARAWSQQVGMPSGVGGVSPVFGDCSVVERAIVYTFSAV